MPTQTISGAEILMREYIKLGMGEGSEVVVVSKLETRDILWPTIMDETIGKRYFVKEINQKSFSVFLSNNWSYPIESINLIIEPDEMPFEGEVPDGWELYSKDGYALELLGVHKSDFNAWLESKSTGRVFFLRFSQLTLKRKK